MTVRRNATWSGMCHTGLHGLDFEGQDCDVCRTVRGELPPVLRRAQKAAGGPVTSTALKPGDRIIYSSFGARKHGKVVKVSKITAQVRFDGKPKDEKLYLESLRHETAGDVANRYHEAAMRAWRDARPATQIAHVETSRSYSSQDEIGAVVHAARPPAEMRLAASELQALAIWFAERPVTP